MPSQTPDFEKTESSSCGELQRDAAWRHERVSVAAYHHAERRRFESGHEEADWCMAEAETDAADEAGE
jgi:hypothetical protein